MFMNSNLPIKWFPQITSVLQMVRKEVGPSFNSRWAGTEAFERPKSSATSVGYFSSYEDSLIGYVFKSVHEHITTMPVKRLCHVLTAFIQLAWNIQECVIPLIVCSKEYGSRVHTVKAITVNPLFMIKSASLPRTFLSPKSSSDTPPFGFEKAATTQTVS